MVSLSEIPDGVWASILSYLSPSDMRNLVMSNHDLKEKVQPYIYHELTLTEWASSGARLARAIEEGIVSNSTVECIRKLRLQFTSMDEIQEALQLILQIQPRMRGVVEIDVEAHQTDDALKVVGMLAETYVQVQTFGASARAPSLWPSPISRQVLPRISSLRIPRLFRQEVAYLSRISTLEVEEICEDGSGAILRTINNENMRGSPDTSLYHAFPPASMYRSSSALHRLAIPYRAYAAIGKPPSLQLELFLQPGDQEVLVDDAAVTTLKFVTVTDMPQTDLKLQTPSLRVLILCNIAPLPIVRLIENNNINTVEFISIAPVTVPALQALANQAFLPALRLLLVIISHSSFLTDTAFLRKREARKMVEWLQVLATQYPVDVRDFSMLLRQDIYFSDGLWCLAAQTRYRRFLPLVAPPPLKS